MSKSSNPPPPTSLTPDVAAKALPHMVFGPKKPYGKKEYGMKSAGLRLNGQPVRFAIGLDHSDPTIPNDTLEYVTTNWGVSYFDESKKDNAQKNAGFPQNAGGFGGYSNHMGAGHFQNYGGWPPGSMPPGSMPPGSMPPGSMPPGSVPPGSVGGFPTPGSSTENPEYEQKGKGGAENANNGPDESKLPQRRKIDLVIQEESELHEFFKKFDERVKDEAKVRSMEWFNHEYKEDLFSHMFNSSVKPRGEEMLQTLMANVYMPELKVYRMNATTRKVHPCNYKEIKKDTMMQVIVQPEDVWFQASNNKDKPVKGVGVHWKVKSVLLFEKGQEAAFNFHIAGDFTLEENNQPEGGDVPDNSAEATDPNPTPSVGQKRLREDTEDVPNGDAPAKRPCPYPVPE